MLRCNTTYVTIGHHHHHHHHQHHQYQGQGKGSNHYSTKPMLKLSIMSGCMVGTIWKIDLIVGKMISCTFNLTVRTLNVLYQQLLGVIFQENFKMDMHINFVFSQCNQRLYPLKLLHSQGLSTVQFLQFLKPLLYHGYDMHSLPGRDS